jgi:type IV pilus assembly protein PilQ
MNPASDAAHSRSILGVLRARWFAALAGLLVAMTAGAAYAQSNSIEQVNVTRGASGRTIVRFTLKAPPANPPAGFSIANPPRIALDFLDTSSALTSTQRSVDDPALRSLNFVQAGNRTRVVFNLNKAQTFETQIEGNSVLVTLNDTGVGAVAEAGGQVQRFAEARPGDVQHALRDVDFRRGRNGEGRIVVDLSDNSTGIDIRQQGRTLVIDFMRTSLPRNLERRLDVADFNTPVVSVDTFAQGGNTRMVIEPKGLWEHSAYQADNRFIVELKPIQEDPNKLVQGTRGGYKGEKLSLNFQNIEVRAVLQVIADFTGLNIITSDTGAGQPHAAPEGRAVGPGAGHHPADQGPRHAQERQHRSDRAARGARDQGAPAARGAGADQRSRAHADRAVPAQLCQGRRHSQHRDGVEDERGGWNRRR